MKITVILENFRTVACFVLFCRCIGGCVGSGGGGGGVQDRRAVGGRLRDVGNADE